MRVFFCFLAISLLAGCEGQTVVPVSGRITLDGQPLANVVVLFEPLGSDNPGLGSVGKTDSDGRFVLRQIQPDRPGALVGNHRVRIRTAPSGVGREDAVEKERLPAIIYNSESTRTFTVPPGGSSAADFPLLSTGKQ
jgi:hypothetical protein